MICFWKKLVLIGMASAVLFVSSCGQSDDFPGEQGLHGKPLDEDITIAFCQSDAKFPMNEIKKKVFTEIFGMNVDFLCVPEDEWINTLNRMINSGSIPDVIICRSRDEVSDWIFKNILAEVSYEQIKENADMLYDCVSDSAWYTTRFGGANWGIPIMGLDIKNTSCLIYNKLWLERLGFTGAPQTLQELENVIEAFTYDDPDGNGINDTYAFTLEGRDNILNMLPGMSRLCGGCGDVWTVSENNTLVSGLTAPAMKNAVEFMNKWYTEGYMDPRFIYDDGISEKEKWKHGTIGIMSANIMEVSELNVNYSLELGVLPSLTEEQNLSYGDVSGAVVFGKQFSESPEVVNKILSAFNKILADDELALRFFAGEEGENWQYSEINGFKERIMTNNGASMGLTYEMGQAVVPIKGVMDKITSETVYGKFYEMQYGNGNNDYTIPWIYSTLTPEESAVLNESKLIAEKWFVDFIIGKKSLDEFESFKNDWLNSGGDIITHTVNANYKIFLNELKNIIDDRR